MASDPKRVRERIVPDNPDMPEPLRREDPSTTVPPDSLPPMAEQDISPDGGRSDHPIHDDDLEDLEPEDYEAEIDELEQTGGLRPD